MTCHDLLDQGCSRARHAHDKDRDLRLAAYPAFLEKEVLAENGYLLVDSASKSLRAVLMTIFCFQYVVACFKIAKCGIIISIVIVRLTKREIQSCSLLRRQRARCEESFQVFDPNVASIGFSNHCQIIVGFDMIGLNSERLFIPENRFVEVPFVLITKPDLEMSVSELGLAFECSEKRRPRLFEMTST